MNLETSNLQIGSVFNLNGRLELVLGFTKEKVVVLCDMYGVWKILNRQVYEGGILIHL